jgi:cytochrome c oxidase assembly protein subunit 15
VALALMAITLVQTILGTQVREGVDEALAAGIERANALGQVGPLDLWHREFALLVMAVTAILALVVWTRHAAELALVRTTMVVVALVGLQIVLGLTMAYLALTPSAQVAHLTASSLLLGAETVVFLLARWLPVEQA